MNATEKASIAVSLIFCVVFGFFACVSYISNVESEKLYNTRQELIQQLKTEGFTITNIEINSPTIYITFDNIKEFVDSANNKNITEIYNSGQSLYYFNEELTVGYKCTMYDLEVLEEFLRSS
jgi:predicted PurR-regulated permease PerM